MSEMASLTVKAREDREYWRSQVSHLTETTYLPLDHSRSNVYSKKTASVGLELPADVNSKLQSLTGGSPTLELTTLMAVLKVCLFKYSDSSKIAVGTTTYRNNRSSDSPANALVIVDEVNGATAFREFLLAVRETLRKAFARQSYPFSHLISDLSLENHSNHCPFFGIALIHKDIQTALPDLKNDVTIQFWRDGERIEGEIEYNARLYTQETIKRFANHYLQVLSEVLSDLDSPISSFNITTEEERNLLEVVFNDTTRDYPSQSTIHELFRQQADRSPEAVAVIYGEDRINYAELNARACRLAHYLRKLGVGPEVRVGVLVDRSIEMMVAVLGILKAGGAYVPLDPAYPADRLSFMMADAEARALISTDALAANLPQIPARLITLDREWALIAAESAAEPPAAATPDNLAYVIYTSGSTGMPKGVAMSHRPLVNLITWQIANSSGTRPLRTLQFSSLSFDVSFQEIFSTWCAGGSLVLLDEETRRDPVALRQFLNEHEVERIFLPFIALQKMAEVAAEQASIPSRLCEIITAGEQLQVTPHLVDWFRELRDCAFYNHYGPTEGHVVTAFGLEGAPTRWPALPPIGRPIANAQIYLLDRFLRLVPVGVPGELFIGGLPIARGYLNRPELTAEKFIPDPFGVCPGGRLYRTNDVARYQPDGNIEFCGRNDQQVKIRGYRIELGEIEATITRHPAVREAVVTVREKGAEKRLVAYTVAGQQTAATGAELRSFLQSKLPAYMVPSAFVSIDMLPLTPSGKVDRKALPEPDPDKPESKKLYLAPRTPLEQQLCDIWAETLGIEKVGVFDNFFELGGDSILTIQVVARAHRLGLRLQPRQIFQHQTVAALSAVVEMASSIRGEQGQVVGPVPLTPIQHWFFQQELPDLHHYNMGYLFELQKDFSFLDWQKIFHELLSHHDALRLQFVCGETGWEQFNSDFDRASLPLSGVDLSALPTGMRESALTRAAISLQSSLNLERGPLFRAVRFNRSHNQPGRLLLIVHHLAIDGVSWRILLEDLHTIGRQLAEGLPVKLPHKTTSFKQWAENLVKFAEGESVRDEVTRWMANVDEREMRLPVDFEIGPRLEASASILSVSLTADETEALLREVPQPSRARIDEVLLTALAYALGVWTGSKSFLVEIEGHGREEIDEEADLSRTVGWFTSISRVVLEASESSSPEHTLAAVRDRLRRDLAPGIRFGLGRYLCGDRTLKQRLRNLPRAEVCFNYLGQVDQLFAQDSFLKVIDVPIGPIIGPANPLPHLLYISGIIFRGQLHLRFKYSRNAYARATIESLAHNTLEELRRLIDYYRGRAREEVSFLLTNIDRSELDAALAQFEIESDQNPVVQASVEDLYPLSPAQQGILFHSLYAPSSGVYVSQISCTLRDLNQAAFTRTWERIIERHPILRTAFIWETTKGPLQVVLRQLPLPLTTLDWRDHTGSEQQEQWEFYLKEDRLRGFSLSKLPLMRLVLCRMTEGTYRFLWSHHHILLDGWSIYLILKEVFELYTAYCQGLEDALGSVGPYRDYIAWLGKQDLDHAEKFWRKTLQDFTAPTPLAAGSSAINSEARYDERRLAISPEFLQNLERFARQHQLTLNTLMQGAWGLILGHLSGQSDLVFGATVSGRPAELIDVESMVGLFINVLPLRLQLAPQETLLNWLQKVQETHVEIRQYEYSPLAQVQRWREGKRGQPLFESILTFQNYPVDDSIAEYGKLLKIDDVHHSSRTNYPLTIIVGLGHGLLLRAIYDEQCFTAGAVDQIFDLFTALFRRFCDRPDDNLEQLQALLSQYDKTRQIPQRNKPGETSNRRFKALKPRTISLPKENLVETSTFDNALTLPLIFKPAMPDLDLIDWAESNRGRVNDELLKYGALLFRGFNIKSTHSFERFATAICGELFDGYGDLPRSGAGGRVYGSTPYPPDQAILLHNESSHLHRWPLKIAFFCVTAAERGGETPIADCREIFRRIDPKLRQRLMRKNVMYVRNYVQGLDVSWQDFFRTSLKAEVEDYCQKASIHYQWINGDRLRTSQVRSAVTRHPKTNEMVFFNQLQLHHVSCLDPKIRESLLATFSIESLPRNVYYGDGTPIEDSVLQQIQEATRQSTVSFPWQEGDVLMLDNMLAAHGRNPYVGPRKIIVAMGTMIESGSQNPGPLFT